MGIINSVQQADPLGPLEFCEAIHPLLTNIHSAFKIGFMDDITLSLWQETDVTLIGLLI